MQPDSDLLATFFPEVRDVVPIGSGGQKRVFAGVHPQDGAVVLKLISEHEEPERVEREISAVRIINSNRVPKIYECGSVSDAGRVVIWIREQKIEGRTLRAHIGKQRLDVDEAIRLSTDILGALAEAESHKIVHRDVKPDNIMVDPAGSYWLLDFGIARHLSLNSLTGTEQLFGLGTVGYAPPEQYRNMKAEIDARADLFALGVTLFEAVKGENPFRTGARDVPEVFRRIEKGTQPKLSLVGRHAREFPTFVQTLMQRRRDHRPSSAAEALKWVRDIAKGG